MITFRAKNPEVIDKIKHRLIPEAGITEDAMAEEIKNILINHSDHIFLMVSFKEKELKSFIIAYAVPKRNHVYVHQAWSENPKEASDEIMTSLEEWTLSLGIGQIRMETPRSTRAFARRFGFKPFTQVMVKDIKTLKETE